VTVSVHVFCREVLPDIYKKGYDVVNEIPKYDNINTRQCKERRKVPGTH
jgi:hypothetical protein